MKDYYRLICPREEVVLVWGTSGVVIDLISERPPVPTPFGSGFDEMMMQ